MYVTPDDLVAEFGIDEIVELTDRSEPRTHEVDTAVAQRACDRAGAEIDAALSVPYTLPLASVPAVLKFLALDLARFYLYGSEPGTVVTKRYETARTMLRDIQAGRIGLGLDVSGVEVASTPTDLPQFNAGAKDWGRET